MRKLILNMSVSADGFVCGPNYETDWIMRMRDKSVVTWIEKTMWESGVHIMGRRTFEGMAPYWVTSQDQLAEPMNKLPKIVFSKEGFVLKESYGDNTQTRSPYASTWSEAVVATDLVADIAKLKQLEGKNILAHGGADFAQELVKHGLVDEYQLKVVPVALGKGMALFATTPHHIDLQLLSSTPFASGTLVNIYVPKNT